MPTPRITYNSTSHIDLVTGRNGARTTYKHSKSQSMSASGKTETINLYGIQEITVDVYFSKAQKRSLVGWWSWARQGKSFSFTSDNTKTGSTTLEAAGAAGSTAISLATSSAFTTGDKCLIRASDNDDEYEEVLINSTNATGIGLSTTLKLSYSTGDLFRHLEYWPELVSLDNQFSPVRIGDVATSVDRYYHHTFSFQEDL